MFWSGRQLEQEPFHGAALHLIRRQIHFGLLLPEEQLPPERKVAETLGISRVTLREAFKVLEDRGYIISKRGQKRGTFVSSAPRLNEIASRGLLEDPGTAWRLLEYLKANLIAASELACERRSPGDLSVLDGVAEKLRSTTSGPEMRGVRYSFFSAIGRASTNTFFLDSFNLSLDSLFYPIPDHRLPTTFELNALAFRQIIESLKCRDKAAAEKGCMTILDEMASSVNDTIANWTHAASARN
ncbi:FadR/GntR family transcriptional regulator [Rhizobium panacihumi]|uniref:FadR/GntR family transcriptional regulator n=1 Tax=Rhizobium panacihumi TaxID=2008450 RepID=UPI003D7B196B